jgi:hypothetical protein
MRVCLTVGMSVFVLLALSVAPASADVVYTFSNGVTFTANPSGNNIECGTSDSSNINLACAPVDITGAASQSIAGTGSLFYYIGSVTANETSNTAPYGPGIVATEAEDPHTFVIGFTTAGDVAHTFALTVPVSATEGSFPTGQFTFDTVYDTVVLGDGSTMTAQIWFRQSLPAGISAANYVIGSSMSPNDASFTWDSGNAVGYLILEMNYVAASSVPEPATFVLIGTALLGLGLWRRRRA